MNCLRSLNTDNAVLLNNAFRFCGCLNSNVGPQDQITKVFCDAVSDGRFRGKLLSRWHCMQYFSCQFPRGTKLNIKQIDDKTFHQSPGHVSECADDNRIGQATMAVLHMQTSGDTKQQLNTINGI